MALPDHYAILLGINRYPGLSDLNGPEHDVKAFAAWLADPNGGNLDANNLQTICSSDFPAVVDPNDANPTERALIKALNKWMRDAKNPKEWREDRVGQRLYLYMAGHGFTAGSTITDPALYTAVAQNGDPAHIAGYRFASKIANAGYFDEIVLIMDCCQDALKSVQVLEPTWDPPDQNKAARVKMLQAYGAPRGQPAFEREVSGVWRGYFSTVLIEALQTAAPDANGFVTGLILKNQFLQIWNDRYLKETDYQPPIRPPDGDDIRLFTRVVGPGVANGAHSVEFDLQMPLAPGETLEITGGRDARTSIRLAANRVQPPPLAPGLYKASVPGTNRSQLFEVTGVEPARVRL